MQIVNSDTVIRYSIVMMLFSMFESEFVLALLFVNLGAYAKDERFIGCVLER